MRRGFKVSLAAEATAPEEASPLGSQAPGEAASNPFNVEAVSAGMPSVVCLDPEEGQNIWLRSIDDLASEKMLGQGASGVVFRCRHPQSGRLLAVKHIKIFEEGKRQQIGKELGMLYAAHHPNIVRFYGSFYAEGSIAMLLEYMDGGSLGDISAAIGPMPETVLAKVAESVLIGLHYMHKTLHCVHRDLKPVNLLFNSKGEVKISDFGVSAQVPYTAAECATFVGTVTYMSPERIGGGTYSSAADIWALGLSLVELALGEFPYKRSIGRSREMTFWDLLQVVCSDRPPQLPRGTGRFSDEFSDFVDLCLKKEALDRPSASELLNHPFVLMHALDSINIYQWVKEREAAVASGRINPYMSINGALSQAQQQQQTQLHHPQQLQQQQQQMSDQQLLMLQRQRDDNVQASDDVIAALIDSHLNV